MAKDFNNKVTTYAVHEEVNIGEVRVADDVVTTIAGLAATEVDGVSCLSGNITNDSVAKIGAKALSKCIKLIVNDKTVSVDVKIVVKYGYEIPKVCANVQDKVKSAIETMTGLDVITVNIKIDGLTAEAEL